MFKTSLIYLSVLLIMVFSLRVAYDYWYEHSFDHITCEEAMFRQNGFAAPQDAKQAKMWDECVLFGKTRWKNVKSF